MIRTATVGETISVLNPSLRIIAYCRDELEVDNPEYVRRVRLGKWVGRTPKKLKLYEQNGDTWVLPFGTLRDVLPILKDDGFTIEKAFAPKKWVFCFEPDSMKLFDYQERAVYEMIRAKGGILQSPAGSGKTQCGIAIIQRMACKALWITHTHDLLEQSRKRAEQYMNPEIIGTISEGEVKIGHGVTFATVQTLSRIDLAKYRNEWDLIIVDECHRVAGTPTAMTMFSKVLNSLSARYKYGLSATVHRADGMIKCTYALLGKVAYSVPEEATAGRVLKVRIVPVRTRYQIGIDCLNFDGTLNYPKMISAMATDSDRNDMIVQCLIENREHNCLILSERLNQLQLLMEKLPEELRDLSCQISGKMTSKTGKEKRQRSIDQMRSGENRFLFATYQLAKEGLDIPRLDRLFMVSPQKDSAIITQAVGRIARVCDGKSDPLVFDFVDDSIYCQKAFKKRCTTYRKDGYEIGG